MEVLMKASNPLASTDNFGFYEQGMCVCFGAVGCGCNSKCDSNCGSKCSCQGKFIPIRD